MLDYLSSLPGAMVLGLIWTIMALGVFITYKILNVADLTVDGSFVTGGIVAAVLITNGMNFALALFIALLAGAICYTKSLQAKYPQGRFLFSPEFLRESKALYDNLYPAQ